MHGIGTPAKQTSSLDPAGLKYSVFFLLIFSANIGSVVDIPFLNPNWIFPNSTISLILFSIIRSQSFKADPLPLYIELISLYRQDEGVPLFITSFIVVSRLSIPASTTNFHNSIGKLSGPLAFLFFNFSSCFLISSAVILGIGPSVSSHLSGSFLALVTLNNSSKYSCHLSLIFSWSVSIFPSASLM